MGLELDMTERLSAAQHRLMGAPQVAQLVKNPPATQKSPVRFLGQEVPLENG